MSTELVERLRDAVAPDGHEARMKGWDYARNLVIAGDRGSHPRDIIESEFAELEELASDAADELTALTAKVALLTEALRPFDGLATVVLSEAPPNADFIIVYTDSSGKKWAMRLDELRAARRALSEPDKEGML